MSLFIEGVDLPEPHHVNGFYIYGDGTVRNLDRNKIIGQATEVPTPHGRLIDVDELRGMIELSRNNLHHKEPLMQVNHNHEHDHFINMLGYLQTVIEEEK